MGLIFIKIMRNYQYKHYPMYFKIHKYFVHQLIEK